MSFISMMKVVSNANKCTSICQKCSHLSLISLHDCSNFNMWTILQERINFSVPMATGMAYAKGSDYFRMKCELMGSCSTE